MKTFFASNDIILKFTLLDVTYVAFAFDYLMLKLLRNWPVQKHKDRFVSELWFT